MEKYEIEQKAEEFLKKYFDWESLYVPIIDIARKLGFVVRNMKLEDEYDGVLAMDPKAETVLDLKTNKFIGVNSNRSNEFKRFIVAHELGHYVLDDSGTRKFAHRVKAHGKPEQEQDVDYFAACVLMPRPLVNSLFILCKNNPEKMSIGQIAMYMAHLMHVPEESMVRRLVELNLV